MSFYVRYRKSPILFVPTRASEVPVSMATKFPTMDDAYNRSLMVWGDVGMEHCEFCDFERERDAREPVKAPKVVIPPPSNQKELL